MDDQRFAEVKAADLFRQQVLLNLLMNAGEAVAATEDGPRVIVIDTTCSAPAASRSASVTAGSV